MQRASRSRPRRGRIVEVVGGASARLQLAILRAAGLVSGRFGFSGIQGFAVRLGRRFPSTNAVVIDVPAAGRLRLPLRDGYWVRLLFGGFRYEPEIGRVLAAIPAGELGVVFDCGANIGFWSLVAAGRVDSPDRVVAVEASPSVFTRLAETAALNPDAFRPVHAALWSVDGVELTLTAQDEAHPANSVVDLGFQVAPGGYAEHVQSITLDSLWRSMDRPAGVVVKLDVEGAEIEALRGARALLAEGRPLVVYEDHGSDRGSALTRFVLEELGLRVFFCDEHGAVAAIASVEEATARKHNRYEGYNFFACAPDSRFWPILEGLRVAG